MKALSKRDKLKVFIAPKMTYLITLPDNNRKSTVYTGLNIHGIYFYIDIIGAPTILNTLGQRSHNFGLSYSINDDISCLRPFIAALCIIQKNIF